MEDAAGEAEDQAAKLRADHVGMHSEIVYRAELGAQELATLATTLRARADGKGRP